MLKGFPSCHSNAIIKYKKHLKTTVKETNQTVKSNEMEKRAKENKTRTRKKVLLFIKNGHQPCDV